MDPSIYPGYTTHPGAPTHPAYPSIHPGNPTFHPGYPTVHPAGPSPHPGDPNIHPDDPTTHPPTTHTGNSSTECDGGNLDLDDVKLDMRGWFNLGDDGVLRSMDANGKVIDYKQFSPEDIAKYISTYPPHLKKRTEERLRGVDGRHVTNPDDLWRTPAGFEKRDGTDGTADGHGKDDNDKDDHDTDGHGEDGHDKGDKDGHDGHGKDGQCISKRGEGPAEKPAACAVHVCVQHYTCHDINCAYCDKPHGNPGHCKPRRP